MLGRWGAMAAVLTPGAGTENTYQPSGKIGKGTTRPMKGWDLGSRWSTSMRTKWKGGQEAIYINEASFGKGQELQIIGRLRGYFRGSVGLRASPQAPPGGWGTWAPPVEDSKAPQTGWRQPTWRAMSDGRERTRPGGAGTGSRAPPGRARFNTTTTPGPGHGRSTPVHGPRRSGQTRQKALSHSELETP
jgi:hypothetical protein